MKQLLSLLIALLFIGTTFAQHPKREKIEALKTAHITNELNLTSSEAEKFWPIYNASEVKHHELRHELRKLRKQLQEDFDAISENEAIIILQKSIDLQNKIHQERSKLTSDLIQFLPAKKIILLKKAEEDFTRKLIKKFKNHRGRDENTPAPHGGRGSQ
jgi:Skp family chaperone for outer membrane proteins